MFTIILFVHAIASNWDDTIEVNPKYPSLATCEAARPDIVSSYKDYLERRHSEQFKIASKCQADQTARGT